MKFGVLGYPAKHSLSPKIFGVIRDHLGLDFSYEILEIAPKDFLASRNLVKTFDGLNITSPYKESILEYSDKASAEVQILKAANVLINTGQGFEAHNTDVFGFSESLKSFEIQGTDALVLGSSGAARAAVLGLHQMGIKNIYVKARDFSKFRGFDVAIQEYSNQKPHLVVQATTIGLNRDLLIMDSEELKFFDIDFSQVKISYDLIYSPKFSVFMELSKQQGVGQIINGENMLILQALKTFELWFGLQKGATDALYKKVKEIL